MAAGDGRVNDSFDFNGSQWLGNRDFENGDFSRLWPPATQLFNHVFRNFAERTKHGRAFRVVSPLYEIPKKELQFNGSEMIEGNLCLKVAK